MLDVLNRGKPLALRNINSAPEVAPDAPMDAGNGFLMREGYTVAWCGWQHDVPDTPGLMRIHVPEAKTGDGPVSGKIVVTFQTNSPTQVQYLSDRMHRAYDANNLEDWESVLTVQEHEDAPEEVIPRREWFFSRLEDGRRIPDATHVYLPSGFQPGKVYQVVYTTTGAPVAGLGLLATRDIASHLRSGGPEAGNEARREVEKVYAFGVSQSGRFLRQFLYQSLNLDEGGRTVFDGFIPHVAGGKRGEFNQRFAQPSSQASRSTNSLFPFSDDEQTDPETGLTDGLLTRLKAQGPIPKVMYTYTPSEYWAGHGSLAHTTLDGKADLEPPDDVRIYVFAGTQHGLGSFPLTDTDPVDGYRGRHCFNGLDYRPLLRAALTNLDRWVTYGVAPPLSRYPRIADGTAVTMEEAGRGLETIPGVAIPVPARRFARLDFGPDPGTPTVVPAKDWRGLSRAGFRRRQRWQRNSGDCAAFHLGPGSDPYGVEHPSSVHWRRRARAVHGRRFRRDPAWVHHSFCRHPGIEGGLRGSSALHRRAVRLQRTLPGPGQRGVAPVDRGRLPAGRGPGGSRCPGGRALRFAAGPR